MAIAAFSFSLGIGALPPASSFHDSVTAQRNFSVCAFLSNDLIFLLIFPLGYIKEAYLWLEDAIISEFPYWHVELDLPWPLLHDQLRYGHVLPPQMEAVCLWMPVAGNHKWAVLLHLDPPFGFPTSIWLATVRMGRWTTWPIGLIKKALLRFFWLPISQLLWFPCILLNYRIGVSEEFIMRFT